MSTAGVSLHVFAYGEYREGVPQRSLGYRLLVPVEPESWSAEVESLARRLQAAPYPDHWPPTDLFCSVLLADGQRLIAVARYGLADHTPSHRRGGLELIGVVAPGALDIATCLAVYRWLAKHRGEVTDLRTLGKCIPLAEIVPAAPASIESPTPQIRLWQQGTLLFAAMSPTDPDDRLPMLDPSSGTAWQWLPLVGSDFPLQAYAQRAPLVAWSPPLAGVTARSDRKSSELQARAMRRRALQAAFGVILLLLLAANLWATITVFRRAPLESSDAVQTSAKYIPPSGKAHDAEDQREQFAEALHRLLLKQAVAREWPQEQLLERYQKLVANDEHLRSNSPEGKAVVGAISLLSRRDTAHLEVLVHQALDKKGYDPDLIGLVCRRLRERLAAEARDLP